MSQAASDTWIKLGPLTIEQLPITLDEGLAYMELRSSKEGKYSWTYDGNTVKQATGDPAIDKKRRGHGFGRLVWHCGGIYEGQFSKGKRSGYGRKINSDGSYYVGNFSEDMYEGQGKLVMVKVVRHGFRYRPEEDVEGVQLFPVSGGDVGDPVLVKEGIFTCGTLTEEFKEDKNAKFLEESMSLMKEENESLDARAEARAEVKRA